jgi:DNA-directed RNA polymerase subunit RPC12/RpoP
MPGKAVGVEVTYKCNECGEEFTVWTPLSPTAYEFRTDLTEEHEDCPAGDE